MCCSLTTLLIAILIAIIIWCLINYVLVPVFLYQPPPSSARKRNEVNPIVVAGKESDRIMIYFHGNGYLAHEMKQSANLLGSLTNCRVYIPEYAGYGPLEHMSYSQNVAQLEQVVQDIVQSYPPDQEFIFVGQSLGTYFATRMATVVLQKK